LEKETGTTTKSGLALLLNPINATFKKEENMKNLKNKIVVVTGAASGIGRSLATNLAQQGACLALADLSEKALQELQESGALVNATKVKRYELDVSQKEAVYQFAKKVKEDFGGVDVVINNAGVALAETIENMEYEDFEWVMNINFWGVVYGTKAFLPMLKASKDAYIVNISSVFGLIAVPTQAAYNASKFAVKGFTEALRLELKGTSVTPICVHPGGIRTNIVNNARIYTSVDGKSDKADVARQFQVLARTSADQAADTIIKGIQKGRKRVLIGPDARLIDWMQRLLPDAYDKLLGAFLNKTSL
jgi:short-subunit dehydrogenase